MIYYIHQITKRSFYESEFILLPYFLYSCKHRKYLKGCKGALYQPACDPHISISISCQSTNDTLKLLEDNKIDIGLIGKPENLKNIHFDFLEEIEDIFVAAKDYLRNLKARGIQKDHILQSSTLMLLDKNNMTRQYIDDYLQENQIIIKDSIDISDMDLLIDFARIGVGVACVIKNFVREDLENGTLVEIPLGFPIHKREVGFAYKTTTKPSKSLAEFIHFYKTYR